MDRKIAKNSIVYVLAGLITFFVTSAIFAYPEFEFANLTSSEIKYSTFAGLIMMSLIMVIKIQHIIKKTKQSSKDKQK